MNTKRGLVGLVIVLITGVVILAYLGITYSDIEQSGPFQAILNFMKHVWEAYLVPGTTWIWQHIFIGIVFPAFAKFFGGNESSIKEAIETATSTASTTSSI